jgi:hypothetical protein
VEAEGGFGREARKAAKNASESEKEEFHRATEESTHPVDACGGCPVFGTILLKLKQL